MFYDRRKGHARDEGQPITKIFSVIEVLQAMLCVVLQRPDDARARPRDYFKKDEDYKKVFGEDVYDLNLYYKATQLMRLSEDYIDSLGLETIHRRNLLSYVCSYATSVALKNAYISPTALLRVGNTDYQSVLPESFNKVQKMYNKLAQKHAAENEPDFDGLAKGPHLLKALVSGLKRRFNPKK